MKKRLFSLITLILILALLTSCELFGGDAGGGQQTPPVGDGGTQEGLTFGSTVALVSADGAMTDEEAENYAARLSSLRSRLSFAGFTVVEATDADVPTDFEIIIGQTDRDVSREAAKSLERVRLSDEDENGSLLLGYSRYCIYCEDGNIAVAFDRDEDFAGLSYASELLVEQYLSVGGEVPRNGTVERGYVDIYEYLSEKDEEELEKQWLRLEGQVGADITAALRDLYSLYSDGMVDWMANLWEPHTCACGTPVCTNSSLYCGGGAFYYSNSGRDTDSYLPDSESTRQILSFLESSGMTYDYATGLPEAMKEGIKRFLKSLQDPESGYFYHPQWGDAISDSRRGRDLGDCTSILTKLGSAPTYYAPNGTKGDGILADGTPVSAVKPSSFLLSERLGSSVAAAVSKVVPTASAIPDHLVDRDAFEAYLESLQIRTNSYSAGNNLAAQMSEIIERDAQLKKQGADYSLVDILIKFLNDNQNPKTGTWDWIDEGAPATAYHANNGVLKISMVYNGAGVLMPNYDKMLTNAVNTLASSEKPGAVTDIYNVWYALSQLKGNLSNFGGDVGKQHFEKFQKQLTDNAVFLIGKTKEKLLLFLKPDGSFSYNLLYSASNSQSAPVAVPQTKEGDVNATTICSTGTLSTMFNALGISQYRPSVYTSVDFKRFLSIIDSLGPVIKNETPDFEVVTFDETNRGKGAYYEQSLGFTGTKLGDLAYAGLIASEDDKIKLDRLGVGYFVGVTKAGGDDAMAYGKASGGSPYLYMYLQNGKNGNAFVFETDFCLIGGSTGYEDGGIIQFWLDDANIADTVMWWNGSFSFKQRDTVTEGEDEPRRQFELSPTQKKHTLNYGDWHNIRFEVQDSSKVGSEIRIYLDNVLINRSTTKTAKVGIDHLTMRIRGDSGVDSLVLFDNTFFGSFERIAQDNTVLIPDNIEIGSTNADIAAEQIRGSGAYREQAETYADTSLTLLKHEGKLSSQENKISFDYTSGGLNAGITRINDRDEAMFYKKTTTTDPYIFFYAESNEDETNKSLVFETDLAFMSGVAEGRNDNFVMQWYASKTKEISYWYELGFSIQRIDGVYYFVANALKEKMDVATWYNVRLEVDDISAAGSDVRIYINGELKLTYQTASGVTYVENMMVRFMSQCKDGLIYFDNTYFRSSVTPPPPTPVNPPTGNETDSRGNGAYYEAAQKYEGVTHDSLIASGVMAPNVPRGVGSNRTLTFNGGALQYTSTGSCFGALDFVYQGGKDGTLLFETDIKLDGVVCSADRPINFCGTSNNGENAAGVYAFGLVIYPYPDKNIGGYVVAIANNTEDIAWIPEGVWVSLRYEFDSLEKGSATRLYINGEVVLEAISNNTVAYLTGVELFTYSTSGATGFISGTVSMDNTYLGSKTVSEPTPPEGGDEGGEPTVEYATLSAPASLTVNGEAPLASYEKGSTLTLAYTGTDESFLSFKVTFASGSTLSVLSGESFTLSENAVISAVFKTPETEDYRGKGVYAGFKDTVNYEGVTLDDLISSGDLSKNTKSDRPNTHKTITVSDGALVYTSNGSSWGSIDFWGHNLNNASFVIETDLYVEGATIDESRASALLASSQVGTGDGWIPLISIYSNPDTAVGGYILAGYNTDKTAVIPEGEWVNVRYEADGSAAGSTARFYVNGVLIAETTLAKSMFGAQGVQFRHASNSGDKSGFSAGVMMLDNTYVGEIPFGGERGTGKYYGSSVQYTGKAYSDLTADGTFTSYRNGATVSVVKTGGDDAFKLSYVANSTWGRYSIKRSGTADNLVFETDILFDNLYIPDARGFTIWATSNLSGDAALSHFGIGLSKGEVEGEYVLTMIGGSGRKYTVTEGEWINMRLEADGLNAGDTIRLVIGGEVFDEGTLSKSIANLVGVQLMCYSTYGGVTGFTGDVYLDNTYLGDKISEQPDTPNVGARADAELRTYDAIVSNY